MEVILQKFVDKLGESGKIVNVAPGYARNYLFPKKIAIKATPKNIALVKRQHSMLKSLEIKAKKECEELAVELGKLSLTFVKMAGENDRLFGSVTNADIAEALKKEGVEIDKKKVMLEEPIKSLGIYKVPLKPHPEVTAHIKVWVVKEESISKKEETFLEEKSSEEEKFSEEVNSSDEDE